MFQWEKISKVCKTIKKMFFKCASGERFQKCASVPELSITHY